MKLYAAKDSGSAIVENVLKLSGLPYEVQFFDYDKLRSPEYLKINPVGQVPAFELASGEIMTESLAICLYLNDLAKMDLVPGEHSETRTKFLRWSIFLVGSIYPTFTFGDEPSRFVENEISKKQLRAASDQMREKMWKQMEEASAFGPWFLGEKLSLIDIYLAVMTNWRPRMEWFDQHCPKLAAIAYRFQETPGYKSVQANDNSH